MVSKSKTKFIKSLKIKKFRREHRKFIAEGEKNILEAINSRANIHSIYVTAEFFECYKNIFIGLETEIVDPSWLSSAGTFSTNRSGLAVMEIPSPGKPVPEKGEWVVLLESVRDPGNLGTIIRTCDWFGVKKIICSEDAAEVYNPKVVNSTMGSVFHVDVHYMELKGFLDNFPETPVYAAVLKGEDISSISSSEGGMILIGNESRGVSDDLLQGSVNKVTIKGRGKAESLNAAVATGIILDRLINV